MSFKVGFKLLAEDGIVKEALAEPGELLTQVAFRAGVTLVQTCGGVPSCTDCKVVVKEGVDGAFEPPKSDEVRLLGNVFFITRERLACQAELKGPCVVEVPKPRPRVEKNWVPKTTLRSEKKPYGKSQEEKTRKKENKKGR